MSKDKSVIIEELRQVIRQASGKGNTLTRIAQRAGISKGQVSRYVRGERTLTLANTERIAEAVDYELVLRRRRKEPPTRTAQE